jgi:hypothetical protein
VNGRGVPQDEEKAKTLFGTNLLVKRIQND